jgi:hypothetical protein
MTDTPETQTAPEYEIPEEIRAKTNGYPVVDAKIVPVQIDQVPDLADGGERKRKFGMVLSVAIVPDLNAQLEPIMLDARIPTMFFDGDSLEDLVERAHAELESVMFSTYKQLDDLAQEAPDVKEPVTS